MNTIWETKNIRQAREDIEILVKDASEALNITPEYLSMLENGHRQPSQKLIAKMSLLYKKPINYFLKNTENSENLVLA